MTMFDWKTVLTASVAELFCSGLALAAPAQGLSCNQRVAAVPCGALRAAAGPSDGGAPHAAAQAADAYRDGGGNGIPETQTRPRPSARS